MNQAPSFEPLACHNLNVMKRAYITLLTTDDYLHGLLVLIFSLREVKSKYECSVLITPNISLRTKSILAAHAIAYIEISDIPNPTDVHPSHRWNRTYSKLHVFGLNQYEKVVFLDADMIILENIDVLFECEHLSAASSGSMLPACSDWTHMNSGLFVAVPDASLFSDMISCVGRVEALNGGGTTNTPRSGSDQEFINAYYRDWKRCFKLHLDHRYNMLHYHLDGYNSLFGYTLTAGPKRVAVIHYASYLKPWSLPSETIRTLMSGVQLTLENQALRIWLETNSRI